MHYALGLDTSCSAFSISLAAVHECQGARSYKLLHAWQSVEKLSHEVELLPAVARLLHEFGITCNDLEEIRIASGPGSFTGLRLGFAFVHGLVFGTPRRVVTLSPLVALAAKYLTSDTPEVFVVSDARRGEVFCCSCSLSTNGSLQWDREVSLRSAKLDSIWSLEVPVIARDQESLDMLPPSVVSTLRIGGAGLLFHPYLEPYAEVSPAGDWQNVPSSYEFSPVYVREVAASTVAERAQLKVKDTVI